MGKPRCATVLGGTCVHDGFGTEHICGWAGRWGGGGANALLAQLWDLATGAEITTLAAHAGRTNAVALFAADGALTAVTAGDDGVVAVWRPLEGVLLVRPPRRSWYYDAGCVLIAKLAPIR